LEGVYTEALENIQEDTILLNVLKGTNQYHIQKDISPFEDGHEFQIPIVVSRNIVCVDECLHFQEDPENISKFPYYEFPFEQCCN